MKELPLVIGPEHYFSLDYGIIRFKESKNAWRVRKNDTGSFVTFKPVLEKNLPPQLQVHLRMPVKDYETGGNRLDLPKDEVLDVDFYIDLRAFAAVFEAKKKVSEAKL